MNDMDLVVMLFIVPLGLAFWACIIIGAIEIYLHYKDKL